MWPVDPLQRTCTELLPDDDNGAARSSQEPAPAITVRELAEVPVFVLLGEPGMGKSETMKALATLVLGEQGKPIAANDFIVLPASPHNAERPVFIDALDEARAGGDTTVWRELRRSIAHSGLTHFGVSCRVADWQGTDTQDLATVAQGQRIRVFALNPLTPEQRHAVLKDEAIEDPDNFEQQAEALGFGDMLGNPQSLKLLGASVKENQNQWPRNRRDAYELACQALLREANQHHRQAQQSAALLSDEALLDAAGWLCALMLLSNQNEVADETLGTDAPEGVRLTEVLDALPANGFPTDTIRQVLQRRLFTKPRGYAATHRTVAEYLAARHIAQRIAQGGLLASRVAALMLASSQHLVSNLRGLAGWLAVLCEPLGQIFFQVDPWAVLDYGDLHLLSPAQKQMLIERLEQAPNPYEPHGRWQRAASHVPLVQPEMFDFVSQWLERYKHQSDAPFHVFQLADALLDALAESPQNTNWTPLLDTLVRQTNLSEGIREAALRALHRHAMGSESLLKLLNALHSGDVPDVGGRLTDYLLSHLYPTKLPPSEVMHYFKATPQTGRFVSFPWFWGHQIENLTPPEKLRELMDSVSSNVEVGKLAEVEFRATGEELKGLATLVVRAVEIFGETIPTAKLAEWLRWCTDHDARVFHPLDQENGAQLRQWLSDHPDKVKAALAHHVATGMKSWQAQYHIPSDTQPNDLGSFWLSQAKFWDLKENPAIASDCMETAIWWVFNHDGGGITLQDLEEAAAGSQTLQSALAPSLLSSLSEDNWRRKHWQSNEKHRNKEAERQALHERNRRYLLEHLEDVRNGKLLSYLYEAAWHDMSGLGYSELGNSALYAQWRDQHPELEEATQEGYLSLLHGLTAQDSKSVIDKHEARGILPLELPCLYAAHRLFARNPHALDDLGPERLQVLTTICLFSHGGVAPWFIYLAEQQPTWVENIWWSLCQSELRDTAEIRIPQFGWLRSQEGLKPIAQSLLPRLLEEWPVKFTETSVLPFAQLLEVCVLECPPETISSIIAKRLRRRSLGSLQTAYLVMAGLWVDPDTFVPLLEQLLRRKQVIHMELLGFVGYLDRYGDRLGNLPPLNIDVLGLLLRLFGPLCPASRPDDSMRDSNDGGRSFLRRLLSRLRENTSAQAQQLLQQLLTDSKLQEWHFAFEETLRHQIRNKAEQSFAVPTSRQVALTLQNKTPANPSDLMAVALDALGDLQREIHNNAFNLINSFWGVDDNAKRPRPPHKPENACRDVIAQWLSPRLLAMSVTVLPELQHGDQKRSDLGLLVHNAGNTEMLLPIEVKGDWHKDLWEAAHQQLGQQYASDSRCLNQGIYLVLWMGDLKKLRQAPNLKVKSAPELQRALQQQEDQRGGPVRIRVVVLDLSIPNR